MTGAPGRRRPGPDGRGRHAAARPRDEALALFDAALRAADAGAGARPGSTSPRCAPRPTPAPAAAARPGPVRRAPARPPTRRAPATGSPRWPDGRPASARVLLDLVRAAGRRRARPRRPRPIDAGPGLQGARLRLADRRRAAQPARRGHRAAAARHARLRPPDPERRSPGTCGRAAAAPAAEPARGRRPRRRRPRDEPIAIVGMACRYPGGVGSPEDLWRLVADGGDAIGAFPDRPRLGPRRASTTPTRTTRARRTPARAASCTTPPSSTPGSSASRPREALAMDPQQRLLLETSWEAFERAGIDPAALRGSRDRRVRRRDVPRLRHRLHARPRRLEGYLATGSAGSVASGRVAYTFGLRGPGGHRRHRLLVLAGRPAPGRAGAAQRASATLALAGGVTVMATPGMFVEFSRQRGLAAGRPLQGVRRGRRRHRLGRGRRHAPAGAAVRRPAQRPPGARRGPRLGGQPGRRVATA